MHSICKVIGLVFHYFVVFWGFCAGRVVGSFFLVLGCVVGLGFLEEVGRVVAGGVSASAFRHCF